MTRLEPFLLEDFFDQHEHDQTLVNLASSDAQCWSREAIASKLGESLSTYLPEHMSYPNWKADWVQRLIHLAQLSDGDGVLPTIGGSEAINLAMHYIAIVRKIRKVALPRPAYMAFEGLAALLGLEVEYYDYRPEAGWAPDLDRLIDAAAAGQAVVVINPHNPTGQLIGVETIRTVQAAIAQSGGIIVIDQVLATKDESLANSVSLDNTLLIGSLSKTWGLPGLRLGWIASQSRAIRELRTLQQYMSMSLPANPVIAAVLDRLAAFDRSSLLAANRKVLTAWVQEQKDQLTLSDPQGGTTVVMTPRVPIESETMLARSLLLAPGRCFGAAGSAQWYRLGYGAETTALKAGLDRLAEAVRSNC